MEYTVGRTGRVIAARLFEGEDLYESIESVAEKEDITAAAVFITGGLRKADVVVGPKQVVHGRHLKRGHPKILHRLSALDHGRGAVGDDPGNDRYSARGFLCGDRSDAAGLVGRERVAFTGAPAHRQPVHLGRFDQVARVRPKSLLVDGAIRSEGSDHK